MQVDPLAGIYPSLNPYNYVANNPINAIDLDGRLIIFINGNHYGSGGSSKYWGSFGEGVQRHFNDTNTRYYDGSLGGYVGLYGVDPLSFYRARQLSAKSRRNAGYNLGRAVARDIISSLGSGETIKIITHSMGGTFGRGFAQALEEVAKEMGITDRKLLTLIADFDAFQGRKLQDVDNVFIQQFIHKGLLAKQEDENADEVVTDKKNKSHSISSFIRDISKLKEGIYIYNEQTGEWDCKTCKN